MLGVWNLVSAATMAVFVLFALEELGTTRTGYGLLFTAWAVGGLLGSLVATRVIDRLGHARSLLTAVAVGALSYTGMIFVSNPFLAGGLFLMEGVVVVIWNVITVSARQALVPAELFGRVNSVYRFVGLGRAAARRPARWRGGPGLRAAGPVRDRRHHAGGAGRCGPGASSPGPTFDTAFDRAGPTDVDMLQVLDESDAPPP